MQTRQDPNIKHFYSKNIHYIYYVTSNKGNTKNFFTSLCLHLCKEIQKIQIQMLPSLHYTSSAHLQTPRIHLQGNIYRKKSYPFEDSSIGEEKTKRLCKTRQRSERMFQP